MPIEKGVGVGGLLSASGSASVQRTFRVGAGASAATEVLITEHLPRLNVWALQSAPAVVGAGMTVQLEGAIYMATAGDNPDFKVFDTFTLTPGVPVAPYASGGGFLFPCACWRLRFTMPGGLGDGVLQYILAASA